MNYCGTSISTKKKTFLFFLFWSFLYVQCTLCAHLSFDLSSTIVAYCERYALCNAFNMLKLFKQTLHTSCDVWIEACTIFRCQYCCFFFFFICFFFHSHHMSFTNINFLESPEAQCTPDSPSLFNELILFKWKWKRTHIVSVQIWWSYMLILYAECCFAFICHEFTILYWFQVLVVSVIVIYVVFVTFPILLLFFPLSVGP